MKVTEVTRPFPMQFGVLQDINVKINLENNCIRKKNLWDVRVKCDRGKTSKY